MASLLIEPHDSPLKDLSGGIILGRQQFVDTIHSDHLSDTQPHRDLPAIKGLQSQPQASHIEAVVDRIVKDNIKLARNLKIYFIRKCSGRTLRAIGERYGLGESGVSQVSRRLEKRKANDRGLEKVMEKIDRTIKMSRV